MKQRTYHVHETIEFTTMYKVKTADDQVAISKVCLGDESVERISAHKRVGYSVWPAKVQDESNQLQI